jgi:hypothetical protein
MSQRLLSVLFALDATLLVLLVVAFQYVQTGTAAHAILQVSLGIILVTMVGIAVAARRGVTLLDA